jgi:hypothetical protein
MTLAINQAAEIWVTFNSQIPSGFTPITCSVLDIAIQAGGPYVFVHDVVGNLVNPTGAVQSGVYDYLPWVDNGQTPPAYGHFVTPVGWAPPTPTPSPSPSPSASATPTPSPTPTPTATPTPTPSATPSPSPSVTPTPTPTATPTPSPSVTPTPTPSGT